MSAIDASHPDTILHRLGRRAASLDEDHARAISLPASSKPRSVADRPSALRPADSARVRDEPWQGDASRLAGRDTS